MTYKAVLVEDEPDAVEMLQAQLAYVEPEVKMVQSFMDAREALRYKDWENIDILFVDVNMSHLSGFEFLEMLGPVRAKIIFTTAHDEYAIRALKAGACDYLLKPVSFNELSQAIQKVDRSRTVERHSTANPLAERICIPILHGFRMIELSDIICIESSGNYTNIQLHSDPNRLMVSRTLKVYEEYLPPTAFLRVNQSAIVNLSYVKTFERTGGNIITLSNGKQFTLSTKYKSRFLDMIDQFKV